MSLARISCTAFTLFCTTALAQTWTAMPLPPGVTQIGGDGSELEPAGSQPLATTNYGANLYRLENGAWVTMPLPSGITQIGSFGSQLLPAGSEPVFAASFGASLQRWDGSAWVAMPLPPGVTQIGSSGSELLPAGRNAIAATNYGANLYEFVGGVWTTMPLPPGVIQIGSMGAEMQPCGAGNPLATTDYGAHLWEYVGGSWTEISLPPGIVQLGSGGSRMQPHVFDETSGHSGATPMATTSFGANLYERVGGAWLSVALPAGVTQIGSGGSQLVNSGLSFALATTNFGANLWAYGLGTSVAVSSTCAGAATLAITGTTNLGGTFTVDVAPNTGLTFTALSFAAASPLPGCTCKILLDGVWSYGSTTVQVPTDAVFFGAVLFAQGADFAGGPGGCNLPPLFALTDVYRILFG